MTYPESPLTRALRIPFFPGVRVRLVAKRPKPYPENPQTIGEHIKRERMIRKLTQKQVGALLGVTPFTVMNWEKGYSAAPIRCMPAVIRFLGYDPQPQAQTLRERMLALRSRNGWSIREAAKRLGVDESTWGQWERSGTVAWPRYQQRPESFLSAIEQGACGPSSPTALCDLTLLAQESNQVSGYEAG